MGFQQNWLALLCLLAAAPAAFAQGKPADWRLFGFTKIDGRDVEMFYSASEQRRNASGNVELWIKGLPMLAVNNDMLDKGQLAEVAAKLIKGYKPLVARFQPMTQDQLVTTVSAEETANADHVPPVARILFEFDCGERLVRILSIWTKSKGKTDSSDTAGEWKHAAPETYTATLLNELCPARN